MGASLSEKKSQTAGEKMEFEFQTADFGPYTWLKPLAFEESTPWFPVRSLAPPDPICLVIVTSHSNFESYKKN